MKRRHTRRYLIAAAVALMIYLGPASNRAEAYIDPGTGSSLFSSLGLMLAVVGTGVAIGFSQLRRCGGWLIARVSARKKEEHEPLIPDLVSVKRHSDRGPRRGRHARGDLPSHTSEAVTRRT